MKVFKPLFLLLTILVNYSVASAQRHTPLPHGTTFGTTPSNVNRMPASRLESFMGKRARTSVVIYGKVLQVTKSKGGWFDLDAGKGRVIKAHFANYNINLPTDLKGREVIIDGVASKQFIADDLQHFAGDTVKGKKQHQVKTNPKQRLMFEVHGLMVNK